MSNTTITQEDVQADDNPQIEQAVANLVELEDDNIIAQIEAGLMLASTESEAFHIHSIMKMPFVDANKEYAFLVQLPQLGLFVGIAFRAEPPANEPFRCFPNVEFVQSNGNSYTGLPFASMQDNYEALQAYAQLGMLKRRALMQDITWQELVEATNVTVGEVIKL